MYHRLSEEAVSLERFHWLSQTFKTGEAVQRVIRRVGSVSRKHWTIK